MSDKPVNNNARIAIMDSKLKFIIGTSPMYPSHRRCHMKNLEQQLTCNYMLQMVSILKRMANDA